MYGWLTATGVFLWQLSHISDLLERKDEKMDKAPEEQQILQNGKKRALRLLERKDYSRKELKEKLFKDGYEPGIVEQIIEYMDSYHYLDDVRVAESFIRNRKENKSKRELEFCLKKKGISEEEISLAMEAEYKNESGLCQEETAIARQLQKYHVEEEKLDRMSYEEKQKIAAKLYRKGFNADSIKKQLQMQT